MDTINGKAVLKSILSSDEYTGYGSILDLSKDGKTLIIGGKSNSYDMFDVIDTNNNSLQLTSNSKSVISDISISTDIISIGCDTYNNNSGIVELFEKNKNEEWDYNTSLQSFINDNIYDKNNPNNFINSPKIVEGDYTGRSVYMNSKIGLVYSAIGNATDQQGNPVNPNSGAIFVVDVTKHLV